MTKAPVLILGARSDIGQAIARAFAADGHAIQLAARNSETLEAERADMELRYSVTVTLHDFDALAIETHDAFVSDLPELPDVAVSIVGYIGEQAENERDSQAAACVLRSNFEGPANILATLANAFEARSSGTLVGVSSVAFGGVPPIMCMARPRRASRRFSRVSETGSPEKVCMS